MGGFPERTVECRPARGPRVIDRPDKWMPAREAIGRAAAIVAGDPGRAALSLRKNARIGLVHSRAGSLVRPGCGPESNVDLPSSFWAPPKGLLAGAGPVPLEDWEQGTFEGNGTALGAWKARSVEFLRRDIDRHYPSRCSQSSSCSSLSGRGRKKGSGSYDLLDEPLLIRMRKLRESGRALSITKAAEAVFRKAVGGGTDQSKIRRLTLKYKRRFPGQN